MPITDAFQRATGAIRNWDGQSVQALESLVADAEDTFWGLPRSDRDEYDIDDRVDVDIIIGFIRGYRNDAARNLRYVPNA